MDTRATTRAQLQALSRDELIEKALEANIVLEELKKIKNKISEFVKMEADLNIIKKCNSLLHERVIELEKDSLNTSQYIRREMIQISPIPLAIGDDVLEQSICDALSLTGELVTPSDIESCNKLKDKSQAICEFKSRKKRYGVMSKRRELGFKVNELKELNFYEKLYLQDSFCIQNQK